MGLGNDCGVGNNKTGRGGKNSRFLRVLKCQGLDQVLIYFGFTYIKKCVGYQKIAFYSCLPLWSLEFIIQIHFKTSYF